MNILNNIILLNRGDSYTLKLVVKDDIKCTEPYILRDDDAIYFGIMEPGEIFERALIRKKFTAADVDAQGNLVIQLIPQDTLDIIPGTYYYSIKLKKDHAKIDPRTGKKTGEWEEQVITLINKTKFILCD